MSKLLWGVIQIPWIHGYCARGAGLHQTARLLSLDETWSVNPLGCELVLTYKRGETSAYDTHKALHTDRLLLFYIYTD